MDKQSVISDNMTDVGVFLQGVDAIANEFLGADRYDVYRASRDAAIAQLAAAAQREAELREALDRLVDKWRDEERQIEIRSYDYAAQAESSTLTNCADELEAAMRLLAPPVDAEKQSMNKEGRRMNRLIIRQDDDEFSEDVQRIIDVCLQAGFDIYDGDARRAWEKYSEGMAAGWMGLPEDDETLLNIVLSQTIEVENA